MVSSDKQRLQHVQRYCEDIAGFIERFGTYQNFITDRAYYNAVCMAVLQIGELANGLTEEYRSETKELVPWSLIRGMRNWVAHAYHQLDDEIIWDTVSNSIPALLRFCNDALCELD